MSATYAGSQTSRRRRILALGLALVGAASMMDYHLGYFIPRMLELRAHSGIVAGYSFGDDFYPIWLAAKHPPSRRANLYSPEMTRKIQTGLFGRPLDPRAPAGPPADYRQYAYPAFTQLLFWPSALLNFKRLRLLLAAVLPIVTIVSIWLWLSAVHWKITPLAFVGTAFLTLGTYEVLEALYAEQPGIFVAFFLAAAALALARNRHLLAGLLMSLTLVKPQVTLLAMIYLLIWSFSDRRRSRFWIGFLSTTAALILASLWLWPHWLEQWIAILLGYHRYAMPPLVSVLLGHGSLSFLGPLFIAGVLLASVAIAWRNRRAPADSPAFWWTVCLMLAVTCIAVLPGQAIYDHVILFPGIVLLARDWRKIWNAGPVPRVLLALGALVLCWPWISAFTLLAMRPLAPAAFHSDSVFLLPIRTAASLPFAVLALLAWSWRTTSLNSESA